jgi:hypothetical protein
MISFDSTAAQGESAQSHTAPTTVLASEAGVPFQPPLGKASGMDPFTEWMSLMEVVQMLCPVWPVRDQPMRGDHWRL